MVASQGFDNSMAPFTARGWPSAMPIFFGNETASKLLDWLIGKR
jgi:hypothetical protein